MYPKWRIGPAVHVYRDRLYGEPQAHEAPARTGEGMHRFTKLLIAIGMALACSVPATGASASGHDSATGSSAATVRFQPTDFGKRTASTRAAASTKVIVCRAAVDNVHRSNSTGLPNVHARLKCDHNVDSISVTVQIKRGNSIVGHSEPGFTNYGKNVNEQTANAGCVTGSYSGVIGAYVVAPAGYSPHSNNFYGLGAVTAIQCGGCGNIVRSLRQDTNPQPGKLEPSNLVKPLC
jgi:hypothetical protein